MYNVYAMRTTPFDRLYTVEEYLQQEETALERHEFHDGKIVEAARGGVEKSTIIVNWCAALRTMLRGTACLAFESSLRVGILKSSRIVYPDLKVVCGALEYHPRDSSGGTILNPRVVIEVFSESTEAYARGRKFGFYRDIEAMQEYVLVSQREPLVETYFRMERNEWAFADFRGSDTEVTLRSLNSVVALRDIYDGVTFPPGREDSDRPTVGAQ